MAPDIRSQIVRENLHTYLCETAMEWYNGLTDPLKPCLRNSKGIEFWIYLLLHRFDVEDKCKDLCRYLTKSAKRQRKRLEKQHSYTGTMQITIQSWQSTSSINRIENLSKFGNHNSLTQIAKNLTSRDSPRALAMRKSLAIPSPATPFSTPSATPKLSYVTVANSATVILPTPTSSPKITTPTLHQSHGIQSRGPERIRS